MTVVAEGIEEPEQADHLRRLHSPLGQGYLFSRPVSPDQVESLLHGWSISNNLTPDAGAEPEAPAAVA